MSDVEVIYDPAYRTMTVRSPRGFTELVGWRDWQAEAFARMLGATYRLKAAA